jgi:Fuc2NAc and GlcNAc transferase
VSLDEAQRVTSDMFYATLLAIALAALSSWGLLSVIIPYLRLWLIDEPNQRSSHYRKTPRGGGIAFVVIASVTSGIALVLDLGIKSSTLKLNSLPLIAAPLALVGLLDDRYNLPASIRYCFQLLTACVVVWMSPVATQSPPVIATLLLLIAVTGVINFTNFMDGMDGLVASCMTVAITGACIKLSAPWTLWALVGALVGFVIWNFSPARVFMGDAGSTYLGAVFAGLVLQSKSWPEAVGLLLVATPLLSDAFICLNRRLISGHKVFEAHNLHLYQRLHRGGWSHSEVTNVYIAGCAVLAIALLCGGLTWVTTIAVIEVIIGIWMDRYVAAPFKVESQI